MKFIYNLILIPVLLMSQSCDAGKQPVNNAENAKNLINHFLPGQKSLLKSNQPSFKTGDFNGDGYEDIVVLFTPVTRPVETSQLKVSLPWDYPGATAGAGSGATVAAEYYTSLAIFNGSDGDWLSAKTRVFVLLDRYGVLETPSFKLLVSKKTDNDYSGHRSVLPVKTADDFIILPTEAGIDTYIYWDKSSYKLLEPEEMP